MALLALLTANPLGAATNDRVVLTPYFYWYDSFSGAHLVDSDGSDALTDHPPTLTGFSYRSRAWHRGQLEDMMTAGIDVLLPVYWGEPSQRLPGQPVAAQPWSYSGLPPLVAAREELLSQGKQPPYIGLFYDTSTLMFNAAGERIDLTTPHGREWFYESVRDYFSLIPPKHWAMIGGQPVVFLYSASFAAAHDQSCIDYLAEAFARDFGGRTPFVVREVSWQVSTANVYAWGGALGLKNPGVASLGPGYDHSAVPGRTPLIVPRENGAFFERNWLRFLRRPSRLVMIETWNEFHEGTDIAHSREYGEQYLALNRQYVDLFRQGFVPPPEIGPFTGAHLVSIELAATNRPSGLTQFEGADGTTAPATLAGRECRILTPTPYAGHYLYARLDESFKWTDAMDLVLVADYFDAAAGTLQVEYDGSDLGAPFQGAYTLATPTVALTGSQTWETASFRLPRARLLNRQNGGADLRLNSSILGLGLSRVQIVRPGLTVDRTQPGPALNLVIWGEPGASYALQTSPDLLQWREISRVRLTGVSSDFTDQATGNDGTRYYRSVPP
ncbi:MAG TPA: DUF5010 domain-containing protein [Candidatus Limnocylindria bacterium]|nr:DUF5010 domain-containing protein [Candidatus Limnocylindria bacterium]